MYLSYGLVTWGQAAKSHMEKILVLQKRVLLLMNFANFSSHAVLCILKRPADKLALLQAYISFNA